METPHEPPAPHGGGGAGAPETPLEPRVGHGGGATLLRVAAGGRLLGVRLEDIREIVPTGRLTRLPGAPAWVMGIMNLRGVLVTVVDLGRRVGDEHGPAARGVSLLVPLDNGSVAGCAVDAVRGLIPMPESPTPVPGNADGSRIVTGVADHEGEAILLVDLRALVQDALG